MDNRIVYLNNEIASQIGFNKKRNVSGSKKTDSTDFEEEIVKIISEEKKNVLQSITHKFKREREERGDRRTTNIESRIDLVKIHFLAVFDNNLHQQFLAKYGLSPIEYSDFNKTVLFQIDSEKEFTTFLSHLEEIINSPIDTNFYGKDCNLLSLIFNYTFYSSTDRVQTILKNGLVLTLISSYLPNFREQRDTLFQVLDFDNINFTYSESCPDIVEVEWLSQQNFNYLVDNFDIIKTVTSSRSGNVKPGIGGPVRDFGFSVTVPENIPIVGIIDTGVNRIDPLREVILGQSFNHTSHAPFWDEDGHGTLVAGLVVLGEEFYKIEKSTYQAKSKILVIKALHFSNDDLSITRIINDIIVANEEHGVRIFNMSLVIPQAKKYNAAYSQFAYELDRVAFQRDLLIFISVGNFNSESLFSLKREFYHSNHDYPDFFYSLNSNSQSHNCEDTNICSPSESLNNISVGALAGNFSDTDKSDVTPNQEYPAHYSRKFHLDFKQKINSTDIPASQRNKFLNKPDFVMEGGDLFSDDAGIEILRSPLADSNKYFARTCGTSLSTPLLTSYAAEILTYYPTIRTQSIKALLVNSATFHDSKKMHHFKNHGPDLLRRLVGYGRPVKEHLLTTKNNSIMYLIEGGIKADEITKYPIFLPSYLLNNDSKLQFDISLAYSFDPIRDNHLAYLPIHISFCLVKNLDISLVGGRQEDYSIKNGFSWSEDHFGIDNRLFSNTQKKTYRLQPNDINTCNDSVSIAVRCLVKKDFVDSLKDRMHDFSLVIRISEIVSNKNTVSSSLYNEMMKINNYLDINGELDGSLDADV